MKCAESKPLIGRMRQSGGSRVLLFILIVNFINLSANFYEGNILISGAVDMEDPVDTITELIFEWALDSDADLIPDNGTEQDDNSLEKIKLAVFIISSLKLFDILTPIEVHLLKDSGRAICGFLSLSAPPPDRC